MKSKITAAVIVVLTALALTACSHFGKGSANPSIRASALAHPTSTSAQYAEAQAKQVFLKCMPARNALTQLEWLKNITAPKKGVTARHTFETCAGVNPANDAKFKGQVENQGAAVLKVYASDEAKGDKAGARAAVKNFAENQIEQDAVADR